jgi:hypothetical protein
MNKSKMQISSLALQFGIDLESFSMKAIFKFGCKQEILEILKD